MKKLTQSMEDYIDAIYVISLTSKEIRVKEISKIWGGKTPAGGAAVRNRVRRASVGTPPGHVAADGSSAVRGSDKTGRAST